jgi:hypothetical protein
MSRKRLAKYPLDPVDQIESVCVDESIFVLLAFVLRLTDCDAFPPPFGDHKKSFKVSVIVKTASLSIPRIRQSPPLTLPPFLYPLVNAFPLITSNSQL